MWWIRTYKPSRRGRLEKSSVHNDCKTDVTGSCSLVSISLLSQISLYVTPVSKCIFTMWHWKQENITCRRLKNHLLRLCKMILGRFHWTNCALRIDTRFLRCNISELLLEPVFSIPGSNHGRKQGSRRAIFSLNYFLRYSTFTSYWRQSAKFY